ncbi:MAG: 1-deoxy-D-xylulose-5-phosphate synthase [Clostridia bacterium]|nr:1-deoxy-D-xylulose-5-phosphate synthase [Clostridia bacterium]
MYKYLDSIHSPKDIKKYGYNEMKELASEIRSFLIESVSKTGGHLASNLGVVEITLAIYKLFDTPKDKVIFDVGHQSYVSKILTGRKEGFNLLRHENGISGFPKMSESEYDSFGTGHSSTSLSAAIGIAKANRLAGEKDYTVVVIGDGAFSGGLVYEALNNCDKDLNLIVILNENEMSISPSVGNMARIISRIRSKENYFRIKNGIQIFTEHIPLIGRPIVSGLRKTKRAMKKVLFSTSFIERFGFTYFGPIDGNDYVTVERLIHQAKKHGGSAFIHIKTKKGKGYAPAEENPSAYHMVKPEDSVKTDSTFSSKFGEYMCRLGEENNRVCAISAAMTDGTGLSSFFEKYPERSFDVGIAEGHAVTFAAGLSAGGYIPVFAVYSSFLQRSFDNYLHDVALQNLHCVFAVDRAGISPDDGSTHHGIFDVSMFSLMNNCTVYSPVSYESLESSLTESVNANSGIWAIRYPKGTQSTEGLCKKENYIFTDADYTSDGIVIITYGRMFTEALKAKKQIENSGLRCGVLVLEKLMPFAEAYVSIKKYCTDAKKIIIVEESMESGSFGQNIMSLVNCDSEFNVRCSALAIRGEVPGHANLETLYASCGISAKDITEEALK